jgi:hypothetical protein
MKLGTDLKGKQLYLGEWLDQNYPNLEQINAGQSNGGHAEQLVGVVCEKLSDYTRDSGYTRLPAILLPEKHHAVLSSLEAVARELGVSAKLIGYYLVGDVE